MVLLWPLRMTTKNKPRFDTTAQTLYLETLTCGHVIRKDKLLKNDNPVHTPKNCENCTKDERPIVLNAFTGYCNIIACEFETAPNMLPIIIDIMKEHNEEIHKPKKGRPKKEQPGVEK